MSEKSPIECKWFHPHLYVEDVRATADYYVDKLGFRLGFITDPPAMAGLNLDPVSLHVVRGKPNLPEGVAVYFVVTDVDSVYETYRTAGVRIVREIQDQGYGLRDFVIADNSGYELGFGQHIHRPAKEPPLKVERVAFEARLEKRLFAVVQEIAESKGMSLGEMLEETLLHSFEPVKEGGVANPHTSATLKLIAELKRKHGIDYETHDSYRFVEGDA